MRKVQKNIILELTETFDEAHSSLKIILEKNNAENAKMLLVDCQKTAVQIADIIQKTEGSDCPAVTSFSEYCNAVFNSFQRISSGNPEIDLDSLNSKLNNAKKSIEAIKVKIEAAFFPYKSSMWDSLESIWKAADADPDCDAYVIPVPYYDRNPDHSLGKFHYEGNEYPDYVPITDYRKYDYKVRRPDIVYIHNPYDDCNYVTSVHPDYYSSVIKKYTDCLVYVPYYATSGGMSEGQYSAPAYYNADYIVIKSEKYRKLFDAKINDNKFLPYGSPKFDRAINKCNSGADIPESWKPHIEGKKVFFYNTSIGGLLSNTMIFLKKMLYVFKCFENRYDAVVIWRPHPLLESTLKSMRPYYYEVYKKIKQNFIDNQIGIYDDTPDVENTVTLSNGYIGEVASSVASLFGVAGKPIFIFNNLISELPQNDDYSASFFTNLGIKMMTGRSNHVSYLNTLFKFDFKTFKTKKICKLSKYYSNIYPCILEIGNRIYACPKSAQEIIVVENNKVVSVIRLKQYIVQNGAFECAYKYKNYIILIPKQYPAIVRYDTQKGEIKYITENLNAFIGTVNGIRVTGGSCIRNNLIFIGSPVNNVFLALNVDTCKTQILTNCSPDNCGCGFIADDGKDLWFIPYKGYTVTRFDPMTGVYKDYKNMPEGFGITECCENSVSSNEFFFSGAAFCEDMVYLMPASANMFISINKKTHEISEWKPGFDIPEKYRSVYYIYSNIINVKYSCMEISAGNYILYSFLEGVFYKINFKTGEYERIKPEIDPELLKEAEPGFDYHSEWYQYDCLETAFNTLPDFIDGNITGNKFDRDKQLREYNEINASNDGTCGTKVHKFIKERYGN